MPNWITTDYIFHGNYDEISKLHSKIEEYTSKNYMKNGFGESWLGNILCGCGLSDCIDTQDKSKLIRCRGWIEYYDDIECNPLDLNDWSLQLCASTAWCPMAKMWEAVIDKLNLKSVGFTYMSTSPDVYEIYDPNGYGDFDYKYNIDCYLANEGICKSDSLCSDEDLIFYFKRYLGKSYNSVEEILSYASEINKDDTDNYIYINEYSYVYNLYE